MLILTEKLKLEIMFVDHIFVRVVGLVVGFELLRLCQKHLILSKSLNKHKLDSLAYSCGMRVFAYIMFFPHYEILDKIETHLVYDS
jgi:hypothetical protein